MIKEIIVVEGKDDIGAVKKAVKAEVIATGGFGYSKDFIKDLNRLAKKRGLIILTDPDHAGEKIRRDLSSNIENCKHAFLPKNRALKNGDIGVENAKKEDIIEAIGRARPLTEPGRNEFTMAGLILGGLMGQPHSRQKRERIGKILGLGYGNGKQFLSRLNSFNVSMEEFIKALEMDEKYEG